MNNCSPSVVRINGKQIKYTMIQKEINEDLKYIVMPIDKKKRLINISVYSFSGLLLASEVIRSNPSMWREMSPIFGVFQDISMIVGALAILGGLVVMIFKKRVGWTIIYTASAVVLGCFLVPSAVMLVAIVGKMLNGAFSNAFETFNTTQ